MAVVSWDEAIEADELHYIECGLDVVLPMAGALREYNTTATGFELLFFDKSYRKIYRTLTDFLNKLVRFRIDFERAFLGAEADGRSVFQAYFGSWKEDVEAGFKLGEVERQIASEYGLDSPKTISEFILDDYDSIDFQFVDASGSPTGRLGVVLCVRMKDMLRSEPLVIPLFEDVERFKPIDEVPLLKAMRRLLSMPNGLAKTTVASNPNRTLPTKETSRANAP